MRTETDAGRLEADSNLSLLKTETARPKPGCPMDREVAVRWIGCRQPLSFKLAEPFSDVQCGRTTHLGARTANLAKVRDVGEWQDPPRDKGPLNREHNRAQYKRRDEIETDSEMRRN